MLPWALAYDGDDLSAFEASATVLANWGQRFYECHSHPPVELLASVSALLAYHAPAVAVRPRTPRRAGAGAARSRASRTLAQVHLQQIGADPAAWAWPLLQSFFSRALSPADWRAARASSPPPRLRGPRGDGRRV